MSYGSVEYDDVLDAFKCEICEEWVRNLSFHVSRRHGVKVDEYKKMFGLSKSTPLTNYDTRLRYAKHAKDGGYIREYNKTNKHKFKKGENKVQKYDRSPETKKFLKEVLPKLGSKAIKTKSLKNN